MTDSQLAIQSARWTVSLSVCLLGNLWVVQLVLPKVGRLDSHSGWRMASQSVVPTVLESDLPMATNSVHLSVLESAAQLASR